MATQPVITAAEEINLQFDATEPKPWSSFGRIVDLTAFDPKLENIVDIDDKIHKKTNQGKVVDVADVTKGVIYIL